MTVENATNPGYKCNTRNTMGTYLQGYIETNYDNLCHHFGEPIDGDGYKTDAEWIIKFDDGVIATIYNWKNGKNYLGSEGDDVNDITEWNVGGKSLQAVENVKRVLGL